MEKAKRFAAIDIAKYISAMLVVAIHVYPFIDISEVFNTFFIALICRFAVPFFFVCSGFFLFRKMSRKDPASSRKALKKYEYRLAKLYLVWTVIYLPYTIWNYASSGFSFLSIFSWLRDFFLNGSYYHLWFLPALMLGAVIVYALWERFGMKKMLLASLALYFIGYLINVYAPIWEAMPVVSILYGFFTKTLVTARDGIFFAPLFIGMGALLSKTKRIPQKTSAIGLGLSFLCLILEVTLYYKIGILYSLSCMFLSLIPAVYFLVSWLLVMDLPYKPVYNELRQDSTLIYVSHILFARILLILLPNAHLVVYLGTLACSSALSYLIVKGRSKFVWLNWLM